MRNVLLLNATYEPIRVISLKRAIVLVWEDKAEIVEERDAQVTSANFSMPHPAVIRLKYFVKIPYRARLPMSRRTVVGRDKGKCAYCEKRGDTIDHVIPRSRGGKHEWENVVCACRKCNHKKADKLLSELGWTLSFTPYSPKGTFWLILGVIEDPQWEPYLT
jgi:5-methylcytosine-specific restriction endonuclease McrA